MSNNISIIEIDLGFSVDGLIQSELKKLNANAVKQIETVANYAKAVDEQIKQRQEAKKAKVSKLTREVELLESLYRQLATKPNEGISSDDISIAINGVISNLASFALKMRKFMHKSGKLHILERIRYKGGYNYRLAEYKIIDDSIPSQSQPS